MLNSSLDRLAKDLSLDISKGVFAYDFARRDNLFYKVSLPDIFYYANIRQED